ncbi:MAG: DUF192 domain-containing protein [Nitrososphaerales archaeon]
MSFLRNPRYLVIIGLTAVILVLAAYAVLELDNSGLVTSPVPSTFTANGRTYAFTYTAVDNAQREAGLMNRKVTNTTTMLFAFPSMGIYQFWMYDTNTSLDMIWINATGNTGRVVYVYPNAQPCYSQIFCPTFGPSSPANYVIEAKAGFALANGIEAGTLVQFG